MIYGSMARFVEDLLQSLPDEGLYADGRRSSEYNYEGFKIFCLKIKAGDVFSL